VIVIGPAPSHIPKIVWQFAGLMRLLSGWAALRMHTDKATVPVLMPLWTWLNCPRRRPGARRADPPNSQSNRPKKPNRLPGKARCASTRIAKNPRARPAPA